MKERFTDEKFKDEQMATIRWANKVMTAYQKAGYTVTVRQLFYQAVSENLVPNEQPEYKKLGELLTRGRMAGWLDWEVIVDRGRYTQDVTTHKDPVEVMKHAVASFRTDKWEDQPVFMMAMIEKQALEGVVAPICNRLEVPFTSNKGYLSATLAYDVGKRLHERRAAGKVCHVIYAGDHDPSGLDMGRDIKERLELFSDGTVYVHRLALNRDQVDQHRLPPNTAKSKDPRYEAYKDAHGEESWELDALPIQSLEQVFSDAVHQLRDEHIWKKSFTIQEQMRDQLQAIYEELAPPQAPPGLTQGFRPL